MTILFDIVTRGTGSGMAGMAAVNDLKITNYQSEIWYGGTIPIC